MKKLYKYLTIFGTVALAACSSMDVNDSDAVAENFPSDFSDAEYVKLYPQLVSLQMLDFVTNYNDSLLTAKAITNDQKKADAEAFAAESNLENLHRIFVDFAGYTEEMWEDDWMEVVTTTYQYTYDIKSDTVKINFKIPRTEEGLKDSGFVALVDSLQYDADGNITGVYGRPEKTPDEATTLYVVSESLVIFKKVIESDSTIIDSTAVRDTVPGAISKKHMVTLNKYNFYDRTDDLVALQSIPVDTFAIAYQYVVYGRLHGWAYRACKSDEVDNPIKTEDYPAQKLYCADEMGIVREIK